MPVEGVGHDVKCVYDEAPGAEVFVSRLARSVVSAPSNVSRTMRAVVPQGATAQLVQSTLAVALAPASLVGADDNPPTYAQATEGKQIGVAAKVPPIKAGLDGLSEHRLPVAEMAELKRDKVAEIDEIRRNGRANKAVYVESLRQKYFVLVEETGRLEQKFKADNAELLGALAKMKDFLASDTPKKTDEVILGQTIYNRRLGEFTLLEKKQSERLNAEQNHCEQARRTYEEYRDELTRYIQERPLSSEIL